MLMEREILHEKVTAYRQPDSGNFEAGRKRYAGNGTLPSARDEQCGFLQAASKIQHGRLTDGPGKGAGAGKRPPEKDVRRCAPCWQERPQTPGRAGVLGATEKSERHVVHAGGL